NLNIAPMWLLDETDWRWVLDVNLWGVIHGMAAFVPHLVRQGRGHVVNTASMAGVTASSGLGPYTASQHAVVALTAGLRAEVDQEAHCVGTTVARPSLVRSNSRDASRNRPSALDAPQGAIGRPRGPQLESEGVLRTPDEVGAQVVDAMEHDRLYVFT